jgi:hypothetical protein
MSAASRKDKSRKREPDGPALTCVICHRRFQPLSIPGVRNVYSICPDCRMTTGRPQNH